MAELALMAATKIGVGAATAGKIGTLAQVGLTAASAFGSIQSSRMEAASFKMQARQAQVNTRISEIEGREEALRIQQKLDRDVASVNAIFGSRSFVEGQGSAAAAASFAKSQATESIKAAQFNTGIKTASAQQRAVNARSEARGARTSGVLSALRTVGGFKRPTLSGFGNIGTKAEF